jgi:hypothetical protein
MVSTTTAGQVIENNLVDTLNNNAVGATQTIGIYLGGSTSMSFKNNIVRNLNTNTTSTLTTSSSGLVGVLTLSALQNVNYSENQIFNLNHTNASAPSGVNILGLYMSASTIGNNLVVKNRIHSISSNSLLATNIHGIYINSGTYVIANNMVRLGYDKDGSPLNQGPYNISGITLGTTSANNVYHNSVYVTSSHTQPGPTFLNNHFTTAFNVSQSGGIFSQLNVLNNIFMNAGTNLATGKYDVSGVHSAIRLPAIGNITATLFNCNNNILHVADTNDGGVYVSAGNNGSNNVTFNNYTFFTGANGIGNLPSWQAAFPTSPKDFNSSSANPNFINPTGSAELGSLFLTGNTPAEGAGSSAIASIVVDDIQGSLRADSGAVDIGADAGVFTINPDGFAPVITLTPLTNTPSITNRTLSVSITDNVGVANTVSTRPVLYYKKFAATTFTTAVGALSTGNVSNGTWDFTIDHSSLSVVQGDTIVYFLVARDVAGNIRVSPFPGFALDVNNITDTPDVLNSYRISSPLSTVLNVGPAETYKCLTCAGDTGVFNAINNGFLAGNTTINIVGDTLYESGAVALNRWLETSSGVLGNYNYTLTIRPGTGGTTARKHLYGDVASVSLIRLNGASNVSITGIAAGGAATDTNLVIQNRNSAGGGCITLINDASNNNLNNLILTARSGDLINISAASVSSGSDNILIKNCYFRPDTTTSLFRSGFLANGTAGRENDNITIENCYVNGSSLLGFGFSGVGHGNNLNIKNCHIYNSTNLPTSAATAYGIFYGPGLTSNNDTITGNFIGGTAPFAAGSNLTATSGTNFIGILTNVGAITGAYLQNNLIQNISKPARFWYLFN